MSQTTTTTWTAAPGDILLLSGNSKSRTFNLGYQAVARGSCALYTHVALVFSPFRVIHAIPGEGVEIRAWREIRDRYYIHESSVARLQDLDDAVRDKLITQAQYYFGQRYSLIALHSPSNTFNDQQGIVCSQFVAQVFHDTGITCASDGFRNCLPLDIHTHTQESSDWLRIPLDNYLFDPVGGPVQNCLGRSMDVLFEMDGHAARMINESFWISRTNQAMEIAIESMAAAVETGGLVVSDLPSPPDFAYDTLSPKHLVAAWTRHFATPKRPANFMHEDGRQPDRMRQLFIRTCDSIGLSASAAWGEIEVMERLLSGWLEKSKQVKVETQPSELVHQLLELNESLMERAAYLDRAMGRQESLSYDMDFVLDLPEVHKSGIYDCKDDIDIASRCLINISKFVHARNTWNKMRMLVLAQSAEIYSVVSQEF